MKKSVQIQESSKLPPLEGTPEGVNVEPRKSFFESAKRRESRKSVRSKSVVNIPPEDENIAPPPTSASEDPIVEKDVEKATETLMKHANQEKKRIEEELKKKFPCCFYIPLDIAMICLGIIDVVYFTIFGLTWVVLVALEPFAGRSSRISRKVNMSRTEVVALVRLLEYENPESRVLTLQYDEDEYADLQFDEESTTVPNILGFEDVDPAQTARVFSRVAFHYQEFGQQIDDNCGQHYYQEFLYSYALTITRDLFEELAGNVIYASIMFSASSGILLTSVCCFRGHKISKFILILLWQGQMIPIYIFIQAIILSQSHRLCVFEYGLGLNFRGQLCLLLFFVIPVGVYKPYELFIWSNYIRTFFQNNNADLTDESYFSAHKIEQRAERRLIADIRPDDVKDHKSRYTHEDMAILFKKLHKQRRRKPEAEVASAIAKVLPSWWPTIKKVDSKPARSSSSSSE